MNDDGFTAEDFLHTRDLLYSENEAVVSATLSNNLNIIIAALVRAAALQNLIDQAERRGRIEMARPGLAGLGQAGLGWARRGKGP